jgi:hypothetical protein
VRKREAPDENPALFSFARTFDTCGHALCMQHFQIHRFDADWRQVAFVRQKSASACAEE